MRGKRKVIDRKRISMTELERRVTEAKALDVEMVGRKSTWTWKGKP